MKKNQNIIMQFKNYYSLYLYDLVIKIDFLQNEEGK